jgi:hypothetical protein
VRNFPAKRLPWRARDLQTLSEQILDLIGFCAPCSQEKTCLDAQYFSQGPPLPGLVRRCESLLNRVQGGTIATALGMNLGFEREEHRHPKPCSCLPPSV